MAFQSGTFRHKMNNGNYVVIYLYNLEVSLIDVEYTIVRGNLSLYSCNEFTSQDIAISSSLGILHATSLMFVLFGDKHISTVSPVSPITFITFFLIAIVHVAFKARSKKYCIRKQGSQLPYMPKPSSKSFLPGVIVIFTPKIKVRYLGL